MSHYRQRLLVEATPAAVYAAITTTAGLKGWWTLDCDADDRVGGHLHFRFGPNQKVMRIERMVANDEVSWVCTEADICSTGLTRRDEWVGTRLVFRITPEGDKRTRLDFEHIGLVPALECYDLCRNGWQHFMTSLQAFLETGRGTPYDAASQAAVATATH